MSSISKRDHGKSIDDDTLLLWVIIGGVGLAWAVGQVWKWALRREGLDDSRLLARVVAGEVPWPASASWALAAVVAALLAFLGLALLVRRALTHRTGGAEDVDRAAQFMAKPRHFRRFTKAGRLKEAKRIGSAPDMVKIGEAVINGEGIYVGVEDTFAAIMGPRSGKTTGFAIPMIMEATGPVVATSNKRDLVDRTRAFRASLGEVWVFDPQDIIGEEPSWYWNPISYVADGPVNKRDARARKLAHRFAFSTGTHHSGGKDYFDQSAEGLVSQLILAAAVSGRDILAVRQWVTKKNDLAPVLLLEGAGFQMQADALRDNINMNAKQKEGIYGTANTMTEFLTYETIRPWITPGHRRRAFDPEAFVRAAHPETLYSISREGLDSMGPIVSALTVAVCEAAEDLAQHSPKGRLDVPMRLVLDEIANVCKWSDLPELVSHYGSKGIIIELFLQSYDQGKDVWGDNGMGKLWSACTMRVSGPGVAANGFQQSVSGMIGKVSYASHSTSHNSRGGSSRSVSSSDVEILDVADLTALPPGRVILSPTGSRPFLLRTIPAQDRDYDKMAKRRAPRRPEPKPDTAPMVRLNAPLSPTAPSSQRTSRWVQR